MNSVELLGNLTRDPEVRNTQGGKTVASFTIAVNRDSGEGTDFPRITTFGKTAETVGRYLKKGRKVAIQGRIQTGSYTDKNGNTVYTTDVVANRVEFVDGGNKEEDGFE